MEAKKNTALASVVIISNFMCVGLEVNVENPIQEDL
jgi:hypothetical protein